MAYGMTYDFPLIYLLIKKRGSGNIIGSDDPGGVTRTLIVYVPGCKVGNVSPDWPLKQHHT